jgi:hypothetical protein
LWQVIRQDCPPAMFTPVEIQRDQVFNSQSRKTGCDKNKLHPERKEYSKKTICFLSHAIVADKIHT